MYCEIYKGCFVVKNCYSILASKLSDIQIILLCIKVRKHQFLPLHPNLVKFYASWEEDGRLYQQFELCDGNLGVSYDIS